MPHSHVDWCLKRYCRHAQTFSIAMQIQILMHAQDVIHVQNAGSLICLACS